MGAATLREGEEGRRRSWSPGREMVGELPLPDPEIRLVVRRWAGLRVLGVGWPGTPCNLRWGESGVHIPLSGYNGGDRINYSSIPRLPQGEIANSQLILFGTLGPSSANEAQRRDVLCSIIHRKFTYPM